MGWKMFNPGCACCCKTIGFEAGRNQGIIECCENGEHPAEEGIWSNINKLANVEVLFAGALSCGYSTRFREEDWPTIAQWVRDGGRLYVSGEFRSCIGDSLDHLNEFLYEIGSTMSLGEKTCECNCAPNHPGVLNTSLPLLDGVSAVYHACTNEVIGGTWVAMTQEYTEEGPNNTGPECSNVPYMAIQKEVDGYIMVSGDSNIFHGCDYPDEGNCPLWRNFINAEELL